MIKGILFDFDGTLSSRRQSAYNMYRACVTMMREGQPEDEMETERLVQYCMVADQMGMVDKGYVWQKIRDKFIPDLDVKKWTDWWYDHFDEYQLPADGAEETLKKLHEHYRLGIFSNGAYESQLAKIKKLGFDALVDAVIISGQYEFRKPDPRLFRIAAEKLGTACEETAMVGDMFHTDIYGAYRAGMKPVWFTGNECVITSYPGIRVRSFQEIAELFESEDCIK